MTRGVEKENRNLFSKRSAIGYHIVEMVCGESRNLRRRDIRICGCVRHKAVLLLSLLGLVVAGEEQADHSRWAARSACRGIEEQIDGVSHAFSLT